ncbi:MAG: DUF3515 domain-containing protein [Mycobacteriales bacterium]
MSKRQRLARSPAVLAAAVAVPAAILVGAVTFWLLPHPQPAAVDGNKADAGPMSVTAIDTASQTAVPCRAVLAHLPTELLGPARAIRARDGSDSADVPVAEYAAAWGDPAIVLRCGVGRPTALTPSAELIGVNGVEWVADSGKSATVWTTTSLPVNVEVTVPRQYRDQAATQILNPLAAPLLVTIADK